MAKSVKNQANRIMSDLGKGFFQDAYWLPIHAIFKAFEDAGIVFQLDTSFYTHNDAGTPTSKTWRGRIQDGSRTLWVHLVASGAGSVEDPLGRYDVVGYCQ